MKIRNFHIGIALAFALFTAGSAAGQAKFVSLSDYLRAALRGNPLIGSASRAKEAAVYGSEAVRKGYYPQIGIGSHLIVAPGYDPAITNGGEFGAQISGSYMIYDGGTRSVETEKGGVGVEQGSLNEGRVKADVIYAVSTAYVSAVKEKRELEVVEQDYALLADYLQLVNQLHASGQGSESDVLKTTVQLNNARIDIVGRRIAYSNSLIALSQAAGLPVSEVTVVDSVMPAVAYDTIFDAQQNADLASGKLLEKQAELDARLAEAKMKPTVSIAADAGALTSLPNLQQGFANVFGASVGVAVSVPVFTFGSLQDNYSASEATASSIRLQNEYTEAALSREFGTALNAIASADSEITGLKKNLVVAEENMVLSKAQYAGGSGSSLDVLNAIQMMSQIRLAIEEARATRELSVLKLNRINYRGVN